MTQILADKNKPSAKICGSFSYLTRIKKPPGRVRWISPGKRPAVQLLGSGFTVTRLLASFYRRPWPPLLLPDEAMLLPEEPVVFPFEPMFLPDLLWSRS